MTFAGSACLLVSASAVVLKSDDDNCRCLTWSDVYYAFGVKCGQGPERQAGEVWSTITDLRLKHMPLYNNIALEICDEFFMRWPLNNNYCTNFDMMDVNTTQWCYTSSACKDLGGGKAVTSGVSWKTCKVGDDELLRDRTPEQLIAFNQMSHEQSIGYLVRQAYTVSPYFLEGSKDLWLDVKEFFQGPENRTSFTSKRPDAAARLQAIVDSKQPTIIDWEVGGSPPFYLVQGEKMFKVSYVEHVGGEGMGYYAKGMMKGLHTKIKCITGCEDSQ